MDGLQCICGIVYSMKSVKRNENERKKEPLFDPVFRINIDRLKNGLFSKMIQMHGKIKVVH